MGRNRLRILRAPPEGNETAATSARCMREYPTTIRLAASLNQEALSFGMRLRVLKSTYTGPKRVPQPSVHSKLSIELQ